MDPFLVALLAASLLLLLLAASMARNRRLRRRLRDLDSAKRSQSVRYGQITEQFAPFMAEWPWDPQDFRFIGSPVDGIQFTPDGVVFVEIKSSRSRLSEGQADVRDHVRAGRVAWREVRID